MAPASVADLAPRSQRDCTTWPARPPPTVCVVRFRVLGPLEVMGDDGAARPVSSPSQRRLLAALLARSPEVVAVDTLVDALWGDDPPESAVATLRTHISRLRSQVGDALTTKGSGYQLVTGPRDTDASLFELLAREAADVSPARAVALLDEALELWRGPAYAEEADVCERARRGPAAGRAPEPGRRGPRPDCCSKRAANPRPSPPPRRWWPGSRSVKGPGPCSWRGWRAPTGTPRRSAPSSAPRRRSPTPGSSRRPACAGPSRRCSTARSASRGPAPAPAGEADAGERLAPAARRVLLRRPRHRPGAGGRPARHRPRRDAGGPRRRRQDPPGPRGRPGRRRRGGAWG